MAIAPLHLLQGSFKQLDPAIHAGLWHLVFSAAQARSFPLPGCPILMFPHVASITAPKIVASRRACTSFLPQHFGVRGLGWETHPAGFGHDIAKALHNWHKLGGFLLDGLPHSGQVYGALGIVEIANRCWRTAVKCTVRSCRFTHAVARDPIATHVQIQRFFKDLQ